MRPTPGGTKLTPIVSLPALYNPRDLALIRRTVASDTTDDESPELEGVPDWNTLLQRDLLDP